MKAIGRKDNIWGIDVRFINNALGGIISILNDGVNFVRRFDSGVNFLIPNNSVVLLKVAVSSFTNLGRLVFASKTYKGRYIKIERID